MPASVLRRHHAVIAMIPRLLTVHKRRAKRVPVHVSHKGARGATQEQEHDADGYWIAQPWGVGQPAGCGAGKCTYRSRRYHCGLMQAAPQFACSPVDGNDQAIPYFTLFGGETAPHGILARIPEVRSDLVETILIAKVFSVAIRGELASPNS